jgi:hypothetical protein
MLARTSVLPGALARPSTNYEAALSLLWDLVRFGVVLEDDARRGRVVLAAAAQGWDDENRKKKAQIMLRRLVQTGRFVPVPSAPPSHTCATPACPELVAAAAAGAPDFVVCGGFCCSAAPGPNVIPIADYVVSSVPDTWRGDALHFSDRALTDEDFEQRILNPVLRFPSRVTMYDRQIGRSTQQAAQQSGPATAVRDSYSLTIDWICRAYRVLGGIGPITIVTGVRTDEPSANDAKRALEAFERGIRGRWGANITVVIVGETRTLALRHERFLVTDQVGLQVGRGFDLLYTDAQMRTAGLDPTRDPRPIRDVVVSRIRDWSGLETEHMRLPACP